MERHIGYAQGYFDNINIKEIRFAELDDFLHQLPESLGNKTRANIKATLHSFWVWASKREGIDIPEFPEIKFKLGWRRTIDKPTQEAIIQEVKRIADPVDRKVGIAIQWLSTYFSIRPIELLHIRERDFDFNLGGVFIQYSKTEPKWVPMLREDLEIVRAFPTPLDPEMFFFRYGGRRFGQKRLYKWWKKACANLGIEKVDLYGGTRHSTVRALREQLTPEQIKRASMHSTNKAFSRYFEVENEEVRSAYQKTVGGTKVAPNIVNIKHLEKDLTHRNPS
jgi:integrase